MKLYKKLILSLAALGLTSVCFAEDWDIEDRQNQQLQSVVLLK